MSGPLDAVVMGYASLDSLIALRNPPAAGATAIIESGLDEPPHWGGCGPNIAVGLRRLGLRTGLISALGTDALSRRYRRWLRDQDVDISALARVPGGAAPRALMLSDPTGTSWCLYRPGAGGDPGDARAQLRLLRRTHRLVLTVGPAALTERLLDLVLKHRLDLTWSAKADAAAYPPALLRALLPACSVVLLNNAELAFLRQHLGIDGVDDLLRLGVRVVVLTRGAAGCDVRSGDGMLHQPAIQPARICDTTGSGDALTSGFLAAYWQTGDLARAARWGVANAASVLAHPGSQTGLSTADELERCLNAAHD